jgi:hypothetical protein
MGRKKKFPKTVIGTCVDCGKPFQVAEEYMLRNAVWLQAAKKDERLHRQCFEKRLGRKLTDADYLVKNRAEGNRVYGRVLDPLGYAEEWADQLGAVVVRRLQESVLLDLEMLPEVVSDHGSSVTCVQQEPRPEQKPEAGLRRRISRRQ